MQRHIFFGPAHWGSGEGPKGQIQLNIIKFQLQSQFQRFLNQTLCVFSQIKDIKHIRWNFLFGRLGHATGVGLGGTVGGWVVQKKFFHKIQPDLMCVTYVNGTCNGTIFLVPASWCLGEGPKGQISLNLNYKVNFKDF